MGIRIPTCIVIDFGRLTVGIRKYLSADQYKKFEFGPPRGANKNKELRLNSQLLVLFTYPLTYPARALLPFFKSKIASFFDLSVSGSVYFQGRSFFHHPGV